MKEITSKPRFTFNTVGLFTNNNKATVEFYTKACGFTTSWDGVQPNVEMFLGNNRIILFPRSAFEQMVSKKFQYPEGFNGTMDLSFDVPSFLMLTKSIRMLLTMAQSPFFLRLLNLGGSAHVTLPTLMGTS